MTTKLKQSFGSTLLCALTICCGVACGGDATDVDLRSNDGGASVGPSGGTFHIGAVTIDVPPGSLDREVPIAVTAEVRRLDGYSINGLVYRFAPHGLRFASPISVSFPSGVPGESVYWTLEGREDRFERLATMIGQGNATARVSHFSTGFVGFALDAPADGGIDRSGGHPDTGLDALSGVTCTVKRRVFFTADAGPCGAEEITVEQGVRFWLSPKNTIPDDPHPEAAIGTDSFGAHDFYLSRQRDRYQTLFTATDSTYSLYLGPWTGTAGFGDAGTARRVGSTIVFSMDSERYGAPVTGCTTQIPNVAIQCSGATTLLRTAPPDLNVPDGG